MRSKIYLKMHRICCYLMVGVTLLMLGFLQVKNDSAFATLKIDTTKSDDDASGTCKRIHTGETQILGIGHLVSRFVILTTDLFVFELPPEKVDMRIKPPFQVLVNKEPKHMRHRFPGSYPVLERIFGSIFYSAMMASYRQSGNLTETHEYIVFGYAINGTVCLLAIDVRHDKAVSGPCWDDLSYHQAISFLPKRHLETQFVKRNQQPPLTCPPSTSLLLYVDDSTDPYPCISMDNCKVVIGDAPRDDDQEISYESPRCVNVSSEIISGFFSGVTKMHLIDNHQMVHSLENLQLSLDFTKRLLTEFIGCNEELPENVSLFKFEIAMIILVFVGVQLIMCVVIYFAIKNNNNMPKKLKSKRQSRKDRKRKRSSTSMSSKNRQSISAKERSKSSKSRKSRGSLSPLNSTSISKRRHSRLSRSSKSRLSRGSSKQSKSVMTASRSLRASVSKRRDSKSRTSSKKKTAH